MVKIKNITLAEFIKRASELNEYMDKEINSIGINSRNEYVIRFTDGEQATFSAIERRTK